MEMGERKGLVGINARFYRTTINNIFGKRLVAPWKRGKCPICRVLWDVPWLLTDRHVLGRSPADAAQFGRNYFNVGKEEIFIVANGTTTVFSLRGEVAEAVD